MDDQRDYAEEMANARIISDEEGYDVDYPRFVGDLRTICHGAWEAEWFAAIRKAADELLPVFTAMDFRWSGDPVTHEMISDRLLILALEATKSVVVTRKRYATVSGGRLMAECTKFSDSDPTVKISFFMHYSVGV